MTDLILGCKKDVDAIVAVQLNPNALEMKGGSVELKIESLHSFYVEEIYNRR